MKVTVCQLDPRTGQRDRQLDALAHHIETEQSEFLLLPEMCFSDWLAADPEPDPDRWQAAMTDHAQHIARLSELWAMALIGTRPVIRDSGSRRNEAFLWNRESDAATGFHDKVYLPNEEGYWEHNWYDRGPYQFDLAHALGMRIGVQICTELWFFEWSRHYARTRADVICVPRATPHGSTDTWIAGGQASAVCSGAYSLSSNLWCPRGDRADCGGVGWIIDPEGVVLATTREDEPFATREIDLSLAAASKLTYPRYVAE